MNYNNGTLPIGTILKSPQYEYRIEAVLGMGGFGITYKVSALQSVQTGNVTQQARLNFAIKEFFMRGCDRGDNGETVTFASTLEGDVKQRLQDFITEAKRLNKLGTKSQNIVKVNEVFEANDTAYYVMEYLDGGNLENYVKFHGVLPWDEAKSIILSIGKAVELLHSERLLHLDIKPSNIMLKHNDKGYTIPVLIDFGLVKHFDIKGKPTSHIMAKGVSEGYAPIEQYVGINTFSPEIDVYALGATLLYLLTGKNPAIASDVTESYLERVLPDNICESGRLAIKHAMKQNKGERTQNVRTFLSAIEAANNKEETTTHILPTEKKAESRRTLYIVALICAVLGYLCTELVCHIINGNTEVYAGKNVSATEEKEEADSTNIYKSMQESEMQSYIDKANQCCDRAENRSGSKAIIQELLDAKYFYYDKAQTIYRQLYGKSIERNTRLDNLVSREYEYWINKGNQLGTDKRKFPLKKEYYENAYKLVKSERIKSYIDWLDQQIH